MIRPPVLALALLLPAAAHAQPVCTGQRLTEAQIAACLGADRPTARSLAHPRGIAVQRAEPAPAPGRIELEVHFAFGRDDLSNDARISLAAMARALTAPERQAMRLVIIGHTDAVGDDATNQALSERRAARVRDHLVAAGIAPTRLTARGEGEQRLKRPDQPDAAENRRVEFIAER